MKNQNRKSIISRGGITGSNSLTLNRLSGLEFIDEEFEILINKGENDKATMPIHEEKYFNIKSQLVGLLISLIQKDESLY